MNATTKAPRAVNVKTPGASAPQAAATAQTVDAAAETTNEAGTVAEQAAAAPVTQPNAVLAPDLEALVEAAVARRLAAQQVASAPAHAPAKLPTVAEATERARTTGRAALSDQGYVCPPAKKAA